MCESIEMPFAVGRGMGVLDGVHIPQREGEVLVVYLPHWFEWRFVVHL